jgi:hypothetical protein
MKALKKGFKLTVLTNKKASYFVCSLRSLNHCFGHLAGKEGQTSNLNVHDLAEILDFLDHNREEIDSIKKEPETAGN